MANVILKVDVRYRAVKKNGHKEVSQKTWKKGINLGLATEAQFRQLVDYTDTIADITDMLH
jgi:hypothetical protein